jgi:hypothetical protein
MVVVAVVVLVVLLGAFLGGQSSFTRSPGIGLIGGIVLVVVLGLLQIREVRIWVLCIAGGGAVVAYVAYLWFHRNST